MVYHQGDLWSLGRFRPNETFQGVFKGGPQDHLCRQMGGWLLWRWVIIELKDKETGKKILKRHYEIRWLWDDNPSQPYELVCPD